MSYTCVNCKSTVDPAETTRASIRCPYCGHRVWMKDRAPETKTVAVG